MKLPLLPLLCTAAAIAAGLNRSSALEAAPLDISSYPTLQAAIDANPGRMIHIPEGEYKISAPLNITANNTGLYGPARIIQTNPDAAIVVIHGVSGVRLDNLDFSRPADEANANQAGIDAKNDHDLELYRVHVSENHSHASILARGCDGVTVEDCAVLNYKGTTIDDRTANKELYGYAFKAIDGTGIQIFDSQGVIIRNNRVQEFRFVPSKALIAKYHLGDLTVWPEKKTRLMGEAMLKTHYTSNWHQGAGIQVTSPMTTKRVILTGNMVDNAAQGLDIHCDYIVISNNLIDHALIGMKAMHGAKHVLITGNQFSHIDRWGVMVMPGAASHAAADAADGKPEAKENEDGGTIISNNIFSDFGFGNEYWNWPNPEKATDSPNVICVLGGQLEENPPIHNILITGNLVYNDAKDGIKLDGKWQHPAPRYHWALYVEQKKEPKPVNVQVFGNMFDAGTQGDTNFKP